jgi:hypothetical protein
LEQAPVGVGETLQELAQLAMVLGHGADLGDQVLTDVLGDGLLVHLGGEVVAPLRGVFVEGTLEEVKGFVDLPLELLLAAPEGVMLFAHKYTYTYAYIYALKPPVSIGKSHKI